MRTLSLLLAASAVLVSAESRFVTYDNARVHYESYGAGKDTVVFIHGWTCDTTFWRGQAPVYEKRRSLLIDLPGHGKSDKPEVAYTQERFARAVDAVMRHAGVERATLIGHSMGAPVALTFIRLFPDRARAFVMVDAFIPQAPASEAEREKQKAQQKLMIDTWRGPGYKAVAEKMIESMFTANTTPAQRESIRSTMLSAPQHVMASAFEGMFALEAPKAGEIYKLPTLAIMAKRPARAGYDQRIRINFPNLTYEEWEGAGHFLMMEDAARFNASLEKFIKDLK